MIPTYYVTPDGHVFAETHEPQPDPQHPILTVWPYRYVAYEDAPAVQEALLRDEVPRFPLYDAPSQRPTTRPPPRSPIPRCAPATRPFQPMSSASPRRRSAFSAASPTRTTD